VVVLVLRHAIAVVLLVAAALKVADWTPDGSFRDLMLAAAETTLASALLLTSLDDWRPIGLALLFFLTSSGFALIRAAGASGLEGDCGCLGNRLPLRLWHQLTLSGGCSAALGIALLLCRPGRRLAT
jgi:hypothetical protein